MFCVKKKAESFQKNIILKYFKIIKLKDNILCDLKKNHTKDY
jgi:hypothetical protein